MDKSRNFSFDLLRIIAAFSVVMLHVSARYIMSSFVNDATFSAANFYDSINRFGVPVFVMISGALFLNPEKEIELKRLWIHNILRIFIVYIVWNYAYYVYQSIYVWKFDFFHQSALRTITGIVYGTDHLWFLGMLIGLYVLTPVIKSWLKKATKQNVEYFIFIFIVFNILRVTITLLLGSSLVDKLSATFAAQELTGYLGYYVLGYYIMNYDISARLRIAIYASLPIDIALNYMVSYHACAVKGVYDPGIYDSFGIFTFLEVLAVFLAVVYGTKKRDYKARTRKFFKNVANDTFGVYVMHVMVLDFLFSLDVFNMARPSVLFEIPIAIGVFIVCALVSALLRRIPYVGRFIC